MRYRLWIALAALALLIPAGLVARSNDGPTPAEARPVLVSGGNPLAGPDLTRLPAGLQEHNAATWYTTAAWNVELARQAAAAPKPPKAAQPSTPRPTGPTAPRAPPAAPAAPVHSSGSGTWYRLADCESGDINVPGSADWSAATGNGFYGGLQFTLSTWSGYGGTGMPQNASPATQIAVAERVLAAQGWGAWPACSRTLHLR